MTQRIIGYGVVVIDEPIAGVPSVRAYSFATLERAADATREAIANGCEAHYAPIRRGDILPEEWSLRNVVPIRETPEPPREVFAPSGNVVSLPPRAEPYDQEGDYGGKTRSEDGLDAARGIIVAIVISCVMLAIIVGIVIYVRGR